MNEKIVKKSISLPAEIAKIAESRAAEEYRSLSSYIRSLIAKDAESEQPKNAREVAV